MHIININICIYIYMCIYIYKTSIHLYITLNIYYIELYIFSNDIMLNSKLNMERFSLHQRKPK